MKKIILVSGCSLALSLLGAMGISQNELNKSNLFNSNNNTTQVEQSVTDKSYNQNSDKQNSGLDKSAQDKDVTKDKDANKTTKNNKENQPSKESTSTVVQKPTSTPAPTKKPAATTKPEPTTKPAATTKPEPTTKPAASTNNSSSYASEVLRLVNVERSKAGLSAFTTNTTLQAAANKRSQEISQSFSHTRPSGEGFSTVLKEFNISFRAAGENIAYGQKTPQAVVDGWMNSSGHRANILNANYNKIGIGVYEKNGVLYWTQLFTN